MNSLRTNAKNIQKCHLFGIAILLGAFPDMWKMPHSKFYEQLATQLNIPYESVKHYMRDGLPLPEQSSHEIPIKLKELRNAVQNIFASVIEKWDDNSENRVKLYSTMYEVLFDLIEKSYLIVEGIDASVPFLTDDSINYLIAHLVFREAWPEDGRPFTQEDRKLLKESMEKFSLGKLSHKRQPNVSVEDIFSILGAIECTNCWGSHWDKETKEKYRQRLRTAKEELRQHWAEEDEKNKEKERQHLG